tara:strand:- start:2828 stop:3733 length:906 start_codon:yes stop_codon:yes gene_type:complete
MLVKEFEKVPAKYYCEKCNYYGVRESQWKRHLNTKKHNASNASKTASKKVRYACSCGKSYVHDTSYYRHLKVCKYDALQETTDKDPSPPIVKLLCEVMSQNKLLQEQMVSMQNEHKATIKTQTSLLQDVIPKLGNLSNTTINTNSHNKIINVQMFLSEKCADAMSIQHFAKQLEVTLDDVCKNKKDCITNVVLKNLQPLSLTERPFHCTNPKNKEWYIKDEKEGWEEDSGEKLIKNTENGILKKWIGEFESRYPKWMENDQLQEKYVQIAGSTTSELPEKTKLKLLRELASEVKLTEDDMV